MRIGVLTDTHAMSFSDIPEKIRSALSEVDLIVHTGDFVSIEVLDGLRKLNEVKAVHGNMDSLSLKTQLPLKAVFTGEGRKIGITHGTGAREGIEKRVRMMFDDVDIILYGHSHARQNKMVDGILLFNPGNCTRSFGLLTIGEEVEGEIVDL